MIASPCRFRRRPQARTDLGSHKPSILQAPSTFFRRASRCGELRGKISLPGPGCHPEWRARSTNWLNSLPPKWLDHRKSFADPLDDLIQELLFPFECRNRSSAFRFRQIRQKFSPARIQQHAQLVEFIEIKAQILS